MSVELPPLDTLLDVDQPAESLAKMQEIARDPRCEGDYCDALTLQMAHALGLLHKITDAFELLKPLEARHSTLPPQLASRYHLEMGRVSNRASYGSKQATEHLEEALTLASKDRVDEVAIEALLELADLSDGPESQRDLLERAEKLATTSRHASSHKWLPRVYHELGWFWCEEEEPARALSYFERALHARRGQHHPKKEIDNARYYVARMWRATGDPSRALTELQALLLEPGSTRDGYTLGEVARCLCDLGRSEEAKTYLEEAILTLKQEQWVDDVEVRELEELLT